MNNPQSMKPVRQLQDCDDLFERRLVLEVAEKGFSVVHQPGSCYTVGLWKTHQHPELILFGLPAERGQKLLQQAVAHLPLQLQQETAKLTDEYNLLPTLVKLEHHREFLSYNRWFYRGDHFQAWQLTWPDPDHRFPDDPQHREKFRLLQPSLS